MWRKFSKRENPLKYAENSRGFDRISEFNSEKLFAEFGEKVWKNISQNSERNSFRSWREFLSAFRENYLWNSVWFPSIAGEKCLLYKKKHDIQGEFLPKFILIWIKLLAKRMSFGYWKTFFPEIFLKNSTKKMKKLRLTFGDNFFWNLKNLERD